MSQRDPDMLPNWDEFGANEELDYNDDPQGQENVSDEPVPGPSSPDAVEEPCSTSAAPSGNDRLPRLNDPSFNNGPPVPNVFWIPDDTAPDDPSCDPEDPDMSSNQIGPVLPTFSSRPRPNNHPSFNPPVPDCNHSGSSRSDRSGGAPSLPDDELRENTHSISFSLPPPEPTSSRNVPANIAEDSCPPFSSRVIGPASSASLNNSGNNELSMPTVGLGPSLPVGGGASGADQAIGPSLPNNIGPMIPEPSIGPALPERDCGPPVDDGQDDSEQDDEPIRGPAMPPLRSATIGPAMPPVFLPLDDSRDNQEDVDDIYGPAPPPPAGDARGISLPPEMPCVEDEDDEMIGPTPPTQDDDKAAEEYAIRRLMLEKQKEESTSRREEWMTQLPKKMTNYGLGARTFSKSTTHAEKDSSWTETPEQKRRRLERGESSSSATDSASILLTAQQMRDQEQEKIAQQCNSNRSEALLDSHQRKKKTEAGQGSSSGERRAFDRDKDMEVRGFKGSTSAELKERCGQLSSRFGSSLNQKFL